MSMTREEAIEIFEQKGWWIAQKETLTPKQAEEIIKLNNAVNFALSALRPISREQVEKVWPGCDFCNTADFGEFGFEITKHYAKICCALGSWRFPEKEQFLFCPKCGKPLTDEAVQMVMERLEALKDGSTTD